MNNNQYVGEVQREDLVIYDVGTSASNKVTDVNDNEYFSYIATIEGQVYLEKLTPEGKQLAKLNLINNELNEINSIEGTIIAMRSLDNHVIGSNERGDEITTNRIIDLQYQRGNLSHDLGSWTFDTSFPKVFLLDNSVIISAGKNVPIGQSGFAIEYTATLYKFN